MPGVFYIVQGECGEDVSHPNCFNVPTKGKVTLDLVKRHFPLRAEGTFHFRFRAAGKGGAFSWVDVGPGAELPRGQLFMKVLRTGAFLSHRNARRCRLITAVHHAILTPCHTHSHPLPHTHTHTHTHTSRHDEVRDRPPESIYDVRIAGVWLRDGIERLCRSCLAHVLRVAAFEGAARCSDEAPAGAGKAKAEADANGRACRCPCRCAC